MSLGPGSTEGGKGGRGVGTEIYFSYPFPRSSSGSLWSSGNWFGLVNQAKYYQVNPSLPSLKGQCTLGDKLQQHVTATDHSLCTGRATSCSNTVRRHVTATNRFMCTCENLCLRNRMLLLQQVAKKQIGLNSVGPTKVFQKFSSTHSDLLLQLVT